MIDEAPDPEQQPPDRDGTAYNHEGEASEFFSWRYLLVALLINLGIAFAAWWIFWPR